MIKNNLKSELLKANIIEYGEFILKSGEKSNIYVDLRKLVSHPNLLKEVCRNLNTLIDDSKFDSLLGVPTGGYGFAQTCSILSDTPCLFLRKEKKEHGKKQEIEGTWEKGTKVILIDDVITSGTSLLETIDKLESYGIEIVKVLVVLKRKDDGITNVWDKKNIRVEYLYTLNELEHIQQPNNNYLSYEEKLHIVKNSFSKHLLSIIIKKQSNIILSLDFTQSHQILNIARIIAPYICGIKLHIDIITDFTQEFITELSYLSRAKHFIIIEDRKFADIGNTVDKQLQNTHYNILKWADAVTVHSIPGKNILDVFKKHKLPVLLIQEMSSKNNLFNPEYIDKTTDIANKNNNIIYGMIGQHKYIDNILLFTPGIHVQNKGDTLGQQYNTPEIAKNNGTDIFIIGRAIYESKDPVKEIKRYREICWF